MACVETLLLPGPVLIARSALCPRVTWDCSCLRGSRGRGGGGIRWVQAPARGGVRPCAPEHHGCSCRDSGLPGRTADPSRSRTVWVLGLGAVFTLLSAQPEVLQPPPSTCQAAQGAGPASVSVSWASRLVWPHPLSQSDGPMVVCGSQHNMTHNMAFLGRDGAGSRGHGPDVGWDGRRRSEGSPGCPSVRLGEASSLRKAPGALTDGAWGGRAAGPSLAFGAGPGHSHWVTCHSGVGLALGFAANLCLRAGLARAQPGSD